MWENIFLPQADSSHTASLLSSLADLITTECRIKGILRAQSSGSVRCCDFIAEVAHDRQWSDVPGSQQIDEDNLQDCAEGRENSSLEKEPLVAKVAQDVFDGSI